MKIDRLIGILSILLQQDKVTAPELAGKFEVSRRTINRDVEDICKAGIPIVTSQGKNGGISIMEGYRIERTLLTSADMQAIFAGLRSLDSVSGNGRYQQLMEKLSGGNKTIFSSDNHMMIDLSSWYKSSLAPQIELLQKAMSLSEIVEFTYYSPRGESRRLIEPYLLVFQWSSWYVWGYCLEKSNFRLFKLNRIVGLALTGRLFKPREHCEYNPEPEQIFPTHIQVKALFKPEAKWRLIDEYGIGSFTEQEDGKLLFEFGFTDRENLFGWLLGFGDQLEFLEPRELRREFHERVKRMEETYRQNS